MFAILYALGMLVADLFKSQSRVRAENLVRVDPVTESHNHRHDGYAAISCPQAVDVAYQVEMPT